MVTRPVESRTYCKPLRVLRSKLGHRLNAISWLSLIKLSNFNLNTQLNKVLIFDGNTVNMQPSIYAFICKFMSHRR